MALTKYTYAISAFTGLVSPYTRPDVGRLTQEIDVSAIITAIDHIDCSATSCDIWFKDALSGGDKTILDGIVAAHTGRPLTPALPIQPVKQIDVDNLDPEKSRSKSLGINFDAAAGAWTKNAISFPYYINVLNGQGFGGFCEDGDKVQFSIDPQFFGVVAQAVSQGGTELYVSPGVPDSILPGMWLQFERGGNPGAPTEPDSEHPGDDEYEIAEIDYETGKITLRSGIDLALSQYDLVYVVSKYGEDIELQKNELIDIGGSSAGSAPLPADTIFNVWFYNAGVEPKRVRFRLNFKYGPLAAE